MKNERMKNERMKMNIYWDSFKTFFKIGIFTLGGGYAMIPLIEEEVVNKKQWVSKDEMLDLIAIAQSCPGVFAINIATFIGYKLKKERGAIATTIGTALPSFLIILAIAIFFSQFKDNPYVAAIFRGIRPAVVALIAVPTFNLGRRAKLNRYTIWIPIVCALAIWALGVSPIYIILIAGVAGYLYGKIVAREMEGRWKGDGREKE
jgi:chromate transporter